MAQIQCNFFSYSLCRNVNISVTLPSFTSCNMDGPHTHALPEKLPVVYLLHGYGNDGLCWHRYTNIDRYAEEKRIAIVTFDTENKAYMNMENGDNFYDFLEQELPEFIENYFPISGKREDRYLGGLSMGGYGALTHGLQNPERYAAVGAFSPAIIKKDQMGAKHHAFRVDTYDATKEALASGKQLPDLFICIGDKDFLYENVTAYHKFLEENWTGSRLRYDDLPGYEHEYAIWDKEVEEFLDWIDRKDVYKQMGKNKV